MRSLSSHHRKTISFDCVLCGPTEGRIKHTDGQWSVVRCPVCGLLATWPLPEPLILERIYGDPGYYKSNSNPHPDAWMERARAILAQLPAAPAAVLDFGAGEGHLVAALRELGIEAEGVEPSTAGRAAAARDHALQLQPQLPLRPLRRFDAAVLVHSLEHVPDPVATASQIRELLEPGGAIFIEVPHAASIDALLPWQRSTMLDLPAALHHFTPRTLGEVMRISGFTRVAVRLFNPNLIEWVLARRKGRSCPTSAHEVHALSSTARAASNPRQTTAARVLATVRRALPGWKFQWIGVAD